MPLDDVIIQGDYREQANWDVSVRTRLPSSIGVTGIRSDSSRFREEA